MNSRCMSPMAVKATELQYRETLISGRHGYSRNMILLCSPAVIKLHSVIQMKAGYMMV